MRAPVSSHYLKSTIIVTSILGLAILLTTNLDASTGRETNIKNLKLRTMTSHSIFEIPYLFTGIPPVVEEWMRLAGLPVAPFRMSSLMQEQGPTKKQKIVLYDSRNHLSRAEAQLAEQIGHIPLNIATLIHDKEMNHDSVSTQQISQASLDQQKRETARFLLRLKRKIENLGGLWIRISDFPYPYQSVLVVESDDEQFNRNLPEIFTHFERVPFVMADKQDSDIENIQKNNNQEILDWYSQKYLYKSPVLMTQNEAIDTTSRITEQFPLTWVTSPEKFIQWWEFRSQFRMRFESGNRQYQVYFDQDQDSTLEYRLSVEIWRDDHVANFELTSGGISVREDQLVFVSCGNSRTPTGFAPINMTRSSHWKMIENYSAQTA